MTGGGAVLLDVTPAWAFFSWLFVGLWAASTSAWLVGDLTMLYWVPRLVRDRWMLNPLPMLAVWLVAHIATAVAHWLVWRDNGGWRHALGALLFGVFYVLSTVVWHAVLYWFHQIRAAFWTSIVAAALAIATTIWFWLLGNTEAGVVMLFVLAWIFYVSLWNFQLARLNTVNGRVRRAGATNAPLVFQCDDAGMPTPDTWAAAGRRCPVERQHRKFAAGTTKHGPGRGRMFAGDAAAFAPAPCPSTTPAAASSPAGNGGSGAQAQQSPQQPPQQQASIGVAHRGTSAAPVVYDDVIRTVGGEMHGYVGAPATPLSWNDG